MRYIRKHERGLLYRRGDYLRMLKPGWNLWSPLSGYQVEIHDAQSTFQPERNLSLYQDDPELMKELEVVEVGDRQIGLHFVDGRFAGILETGRHAFWKVVEKHEVRLYDRSQPEVPGDIEPAVLNRPTVKIRTSVHQVAEHEAGLLFYDGVYVKRLAPGNYRYWKGPVDVRVQLVDLRDQQMDMTGQEVMTRDKVTLRLNFVLQYRITDPVRVGTRIKQFDAQLYVQLQLVLREYVGSLELDELLQNKEQISRFVLERMRDQSESLGAEFLYAGVKDVVLPGEVREILNMVLVAQKKAQANVITRREETASTRSLLNTARLMDENPTLYRLKELEFLESVAEKVGNISLMGGGTLLEHLGGVIGDRGKHSGVRKDA